MCAPAVGHGAGVSITGKVNSGYVQVGESVYVLPAQEMASIKCKCVLLYSYESMAGIWTCSSAFISHQPAE